MRRFAIVLLIVGLGAGAAPAADPARPSDTIFHAMTDEMNRTIDRLEVGGLGKPYFAAFTVRDARDVAIDGTLGSLKRSDERHSRDLKPTLRVGGAEFDNTHYVEFESWRLDSQSWDLATDDDYDALRYGIWSACDRAYKGAVATLAKKRAYRQKKLIKEILPDLSADPVQSSVAEPTVIAFNSVVWGERVRQMSAVFRKYPALQDSSVNLRWSQCDTYFVDSQGRKAFKCDNGLDISMEASTQASDGRRLVDRRRVMRLSLANLPSPEGMAAAAASLAADVTAVAKAPAWEGEYVGPVLFEGQAAGEFFLQLLAKNVSFTRSPWAEDELGPQGADSGGAFAGRLGLRVVSPLLSAVDDPTLDAFEGKPLAGHYQVDDEGIPAQRVTLIEKGILKDVPMSRAPIKGREHSNGHGRADSALVPSARVGNLLISAEKTLTPEELKKELLRQAAEQGLDYAVIVRRMQGEDVKEGEELLSAPVMAYKAYVKDGREELIRGAQFSGVTVRALRDVLAAGDTRQVYNTWQGGGTHWRPDRVRVSVVCPSVIVGEMELKESSEKPDALPHMDRPAME